MSPFVDGDINPGASPCQGEGHGSSRGLGEGDFLGAQPPFSTHPSDAKIQKESKKPFYGVSQVSASIPVQARENAKRSHKIDKINRRVLKAKRMASAKNA